MMPEFIPGLQLSETFYHQVVRPILDQQVPNLRYSAGLIGWGSDVLGFDTPTSRDHMWGPRLYIFLEDRSDCQPLHEMLRHRLPPTFRGYSVHFGPPDEADGGTRVVGTFTGGPVEHLVQVTTIDACWQGELGITRDASPRAVDWLTFSEQALLALTAGKIFHDTLGLEAVRARYAYYPDDVWRYLMAAQWALIAQEEAFVGRTDSVGDDAGSRILTARLVERVMRLCFFLERRYAPYSKWFGTAFQRLACAPRFQPLIAGALAANTFAERDHFLSGLYTNVAEMHNSLALTPPLETSTRTYSGWHMLRVGVDALAPEHPKNTRPYQTIFGGRFTDALLDTIQDPEVRAFLPVVGSVNQFLMPSSDALQNVQFCRGMAPLLQPYDPGQKTGPRKDKTEVSL